MFDIVLTSETIYRMDSLPSLTETMRLACCGSQNKLMEEVAIRKKGECLVAAKVLYFGVGGGVSDFVSYVEKQGIATAEIVRERNIGIGRSVLSLNFIIWTSTNHWNWYWIEGLWAKKADFTNLVLCVHFDWWWPSHIQIKQERERLMTTGFIRIISPSFIKSSAVSTSVSAPERIFGTRFWATNIFGTVLVWFCVTVIRNMS